MVPPYNALRVQSQLLGKPKYNKNKSSISQTADLFILSFITHYSVIPGEFRGIYKGLLEYKKRSNELCLLDKSSQSFTEDFKGNPQVHQENCNWEGTALSAGEGAHDVDPWWFESYSVTTSDLCV